MRNAKQLSLANIYIDCNHFFENDKCHFLSLLLMHLTSINPCSVNCILKEHTIPLLIHAPDLKARTMPLTKTIFPATLMVKIFL